MGNATCVDTDGHVLERPADIRKYLEAPWNERDTPLWPGDQPWDPNLFKGFKMAVNWEGLAPRSRCGAGIRSWTKQDMETASAFPRARATSPRTRKYRSRWPRPRPPTPTFAKEYNALSNRLSCVGSCPCGRRRRPPRSSGARLMSSASRVSRSSPRGCPSPSARPTTIPSTGRRGGGRGARNSRHPQPSRELGAATLSTFAEVHSYAFTAGILLQFTSMVCQGTRRGSRS